MGRTTHRYIEHKLTLLGFNGIILGCKMTLFGLLCSSGHLPACCRWLGDTQARAGVPRVQVSPLPPPHWLPWELCGSWRVRISLQQPCDSQGQCLQELGDRDSPSPMKSQVMGEAAASPQVSVGGHVPFARCGGRWIPSYPSSPGCRYRHLPDLAVWALWFWVTD